MATILVYFAYFKGWIFADFKNVSPQEAHNLLSSPHKIILIDVRSKKLFAKDHIENSRHISMESLNSFPSTSSGNDGRKVLVYSERGELSVEASRILAKRGFEVLNLEGGVIFWIRAGYEVVSD